MTVTNRQECDKTVS